MRLKLICGSHHRLGSFTLHNVCLQGSYYLARKHRQAHSNMRRSGKDECVNIVWFCWLPYFTYLFGLYVAFCVSA